MNDRFDDPLPPTDDDNERLIRVPADDAVDLESTDQPAEPVFQKSLLSYLTLFFLLVFMPASSLLLVGNPTETLSLLAQSPIYFIYLPTMLTWWGAFLLIYLTVHREKTTLAGIGFRRLRLLDFFWAFAFLLASNLLLSLLALLLAQIGLEIPGEVELILPKTNAERIVWVLLSFTAGFCEETAFRGYLLTRIKIFGNTRGWLLPVIISSLAFGSGHAYQGLGGFILLSIYGAMFAFLFLRTGGIWAPIIAHFFQDFSALFFPFQR